MKTRRPYFLLLLAAAVSLFGQTKKIEPMRGVNRSQSQASVATLLIGINGTIGSVAEPGWPLIVSATRATDETAPSLPSNLSLKLTDERGTPMAITFERVVQTASEGTVSLYWLVAESGTRSLTPGRFRVSSATDPSALAGWRIETGEFLVVAPSAEHSSLLGHLKLHRLVLQGKDDEALAEIDRILAANPKDGHAWIAKGDIQMLKGNPDDALQAYDQALSLRQKSDGESLMITARRRDAFFRSLEKRGVVPPKSPL